MHLIFLSIIAAINSMSEFVHMKCFSKCYYQLTTLVELKLLYLYTELE